MMEIVVLGCGPSGLLAAHAAMREGASVAILSRKRKSYIAGAQYLHTHVPDLADPQPNDWIQIRKQGTRDLYALKVYGYAEAPVSWDLYETGRQVPAWNLRSMYENLWQRWEGLITPAELSVTKLMSIKEEFRPDLIISTVPAPLLCRRRRKVLREPDPHQFLSQTVHILQMEDEHPYSESFIEYNGEKEPAYYRRSLIFGTEAVEWSGRGPKPPIDDVITIEKPLATDCDCWDDDPTVLKQGRYGAWDKAFLTHHVFDNVELAIQKAKARV